LFFFFEEAKLTS